MNSKGIIFAKRNLKEAYREPSSLIFMFILPIILLCLMSVIQNGTGGAAPQFQIELITGGMIIFSMSFTSLFCGLILAKDRSSSFLTRLYASPMKPKDYIIGYFLPFLPIGIIQVVLCFLMAFIFGLSFNINLVIAFLVLIPILFFFISLGLLFGTLLNDKNVAPISSVVVNVSALISGTWFPLSMVGGAYEFISYLFPFAHAYDCAKNALTGVGFGEYWFSFVVTILYAIATFVIALLIFKRKMKNN